MSKLLEILGEESKVTSTANGGKAYNTTGSALLDAYTKLGNYRRESDTEILSTFLPALSEDRNMAIKLAFYIRSIRNIGLGERRVYRVILKYLANVEGICISSNFYNIVFYGRYDDLLCLLGTKIKNKVLAYISVTLLNDLKSEYPTLCAKWMPSINASSKESIRMAHMIKDFMGLSNKEYRIMLKNLRDRLNVIESLMSSGKWNEIEYAKVPSNAMTMYRNAFMKHDEDRFSEYIDLLNEGKTKINASTVYPDVIFNKLGLEYTGRNFTLTNFKDTILNAQWANLPNYVSGENKILVMADTSGSMCGKPIEVAISLAVYFAERNKGVWANKMLTFSSSPSFVELTGNTLFEKVNKIPAIISNTDLYKAFNLILNIAINNRLTKEDMPKALIIITDGQFDCMVNNSNTVYEKVKKDFINSGYELPNIIFWNVAGRDSVFQTDKNSIGVQMVGGSSPSVFKAVLESLDKTPYEAMIQTLNNEYFDKIVLDK